jgi:hypothetical protein
MQEVCRFHLHQIVNDSQHFQDSITRAHTGSIERTWSAVKSFYHDAV